MIGIVVIFLIRTIFVLYLHRQYVVQYNSSHAEGVDLKLYTTTLMLFLVGLEVFMLMLLCEHIKIYRHLQKRRTR